MVFWLATGREGRLQSVTFAYSLLYFTHNFATTFEKCQVANAENRKFLYYYYSIFKCFIPYWTVKLLLSFCKCWTETKKLQLKRIFISGQSEFFVMRVKLIEFISVSRYCTPAWCIYPHKNPKWNHHPSPFLFLFLGSDIRGTMTNAVSFGQVTMAHFPAGLSNAGRWEVEDRRVFPNLEKRR